MYDKNDKRRLMWLVDEFLSNRISANVFCDEFYYCFDLELDRGILSDCEYSIWLELSRVTDRFTSFKEDIADYPGVFFTEPQLRAQVEDSRKRISDC